MKRLALGACILFLVGASAKADLFTVAQSNGPYWSGFRGQTLTPSVQGDGVGSSGAGSIVYLSSFQYYNGASFGSYPSIMYIYQSKPSLEDLNLGIGALYSSTSMSDGLYQFEDVPLTRTNKYWALFPQDIAPLMYSDTDSYTGGWIVATVSLNETVGDMKFVATFDTVPEPTTIGLLAVGGLALIRRRTA